MMITSTSPLPVSSVLFQPRAGAYALTVVCKATYALAPMESKLAAEQEPIHEHDKSREGEAGPGDAPRAIYAASDVAPLKIAADVLLVGECFAPQGVPQRSLRTRLLVASVDKTIEVYLDRWFNQQGILQEGPRFTRMPLGYERAAGGPETWNPVGARRAERDRYGRTIVPNLQRPDAVVSAASDYIEPVGYGPIARNWPSRQSKLGLRAAVWASGGALSGPLPEDLDRAYFNAAPPDQQTTEIREDERIVLDNLHPEIPHFVTNLAGGRPRAALTGAGRAAPVELPLRADTLWIDTTRRICTLTWRGQVLLSRPDEEGRVIVALERPGHALSVEEIVRGARSLKDLDGSSTMRIDEEATSSEGRAALPFAPADSVSPEIARAPSPPRPPPRKSIGDMTLTIDRSTPLRDVPLTPFVAPSASGARPPANAPPPPPAFAPAGPPPPAFAAAGPPPPAFAPPVASPPPLPVPVSTPWAGAASAGAATMEPRAAFQAPSISEMGEAPPVPGYLQPPAPHTAPPVDLAPPPIMPAPSIGMLMAASNAAAAATAPAEAEIAPEIEPAKAIEAPSDEVITLVGFEAKAVPRMERKPAFRRILDALDDEPVDPEDDDPALSDDGAAIERRAHVFAILDRAAAVDLEAALGAVARGGGRRGRVTPPIELFEGDLTMALDETESLAAWVSAVMPFAEGEEATLRAVQTSKDFLASPGAKSASRTAAALVAQLRAAYEAGKQRVPLATLNRQVERAMLEKRAYRTHKVLGGPHLVGALAFVGHEEPVIVYLPEAFSAEMPLAVTSRARLVAEVHPAFDDEQKLPIALRCVAMARLVRMAR